MRTRVIRTGIGFSKNDSHCAALLSVAAAGAAALVLAFAGLALHAVQTALADIPAGLTALSDDLPPARGPGAEQS